MMSDRKHKYTAMVGAFHLPEETFLDYSRSCFQQYEIAKDAAMKKPVAGHNDWTLCLLRLLHLVTGIRVTGSPLWNLPSVINRDGTLVMPMDKLVSQLHATRPAGLGTFIANEIVDYTRHTKRVRHSIETYGKDAQRRTRHD